MAVVSGPLDLSTRLSQFMNEMDGANSSYSCSLHDLPIRDPVLFQGAENPNACSLHELPLPGLINSYKTHQTTQAVANIFQRTPLKVSRGVKQYLYDDNNAEYLDCVNSTAHVGHCHPQVVSAGHTQMAKLSTAQGFGSDILAKYTKELLASVPEPLSVCYLCNSGSEANDLALRLARQYTGGTEVVAMEDGFHGILGVLVDLSSKMHSKVPNFKKPEWVHLVPLPDTYKIKTEEDWSKYLSEFEAEVATVDKTGRKLIAFIFEPLFAIPGVHIPPKYVIKSMFRSIRSRGGLVIADEVQTGLGRTGEHMWGFMNYEVVPDIVTLGKPLGNGHPMGAVLCSQEVSRRLGGYFTTFGGNPVSCAIGLSVLDVVLNEKLMSSAKMVGKYLTAEFTKLKERHQHLGDHRGLGLLHSIEIVVDKLSSTPAPVIATEIMYGMKQKNVLVAITGKNKNIILITPPMCFNIENSRRLIRYMDEVFTTLERNTENHSVIVLRDSLEAIPRERLKRGMFGGEVEAAKRIRISESSDGDGYEDMD